MKNIFDKLGDKDITDQYKHIRIGMILDVDTVKATVTLQWLDKSGSRVEVPIPMPFCEQGWGIYAMPYKYALVVCDVRTYEMPIIMAYLPPNFMNEDNSWATFKKISSFPAHKDGTPFASGDIIVRNLIGKAKCQSCGVVSTIGEWAATYSYNDENAKIKMESCPSCKTPAYEVSNDGEVTTVNRIQLGIMMYLQNDGVLRIRINDGLSKADPNDTFASGSLITLEFDEHSNVVIDGIQNSTLGAVNTTQNIEETETISCKNSTKTIAEDETISSKNTTRNIEEKEVITSAESHETTDKKLIESDDIKLGDTSAMSIGQAQKIITIVTRLMTELALHTHVSAAPGSPTGPMVSAPPLTIPQVTEIETTKTKAT